MILEIVKFGHPALREPGQPLGPVTPEIRRLAADMLETMYAANGVGLAAQQVGRPLLLTVIDVRGSEMPWTMTPELPMPLVLVNPRLSQLQGEETSVEGCLSIPDVSADIRRAARITVAAATLEGDQREFSCTGLLARAVQHEVDHLNGILFTERMDAATRAGFAGQLKRLQKETRATLKQARGPRLVARSG